MSLCWATAEHLIDTLQKVGYGRGFLTSRPSSSWSQRIVLLFVLFKRVKLLTQPNFPRAPTPLPCEEPFEFQEGFSLRKQTVMMDSVHPLITSSSSSYS
jgi:hypothetical protein